MARVVPTLRCLLAIGVVLFAGVILWRQLHGLSMAQLHAACRATTTTSIVLAVLATTVSFACLAGYEWFATARTVPGRIPVRTALRVGAAAHAIANTLGFHTVTAGAFRYRAYRRFGLGVADVTRVVVVVGLCVAAGVASICGLAALRLAGGRSMVVVSIALAGLFALASLVRIQRPAVTRTEILLQSAVIVCVMGTIEMAGSIGALYVLMPSSVILEPAPFVLMFVSATLLGIVSHVPGGVGVFEAAILAALPSDRHADLLIALLGYRLIYNLVPFLLALITEVSATVRSARGGVPRINSMADRSASPAADARAGEPA